VVASHESDGGQNCRSQGRPRRSGSRQAQTLERGASRSSVNVRHNNQLKDGDIRELNLIFLALTHCIRRTEIPLLAHNLSK
jgi:hypothetical protein